MSVLILVVVALVRVSLFLWAFMRVWILKWLSDILGINHGVIPGYICGEGVWEQLVLSLQQVSIKIFLVLFIHLFLLIQIFIYFLFILGIIVDSAFSNMK